MVHLPAGNYLMRSGMTVGAYWPLAFIRSAIIALLALALMEPAIQRSAAPISVAYLLDVSQSVAPADIQSAIQWIRRTNDSGRPDHARYIPFGENARVFDSLDRLEAVGVAEGPSDDAGDAIHQNATNIEVAVDNALQNFAPHHLKRLVLITDGNENQGRVLNMVRRLQSEKVRVYTMPLEERLSRDVSIESIETSPEVAAQEPFSVEVDVHSRVRTSAHVELRHGETTLGSREVPLVAGLNRIPFETSRKDESGSVMLEADVRSPDDRFAGNNRFRKSIVVHGKPAVLYVEGHPQSARYFEAALRVEGFAVTTLPAAAIPDSGRELDGYDVLVLSDVARSSLNEQQMRALATFETLAAASFLRPCPALVSSACPAYFLRARLIPTRRLPQTAFWRPTPPDPQPHPLLIPTIRLGSVDNRSDKAAGQFGATAKYANSFLAVERAVTLESTTN